MDVGQGPSRPGAAAGRRVDWEPVALAGGLVAYNVALNHVPFPPWSYVPANLALAAGVALAARWRWGLDARALGLTRESVRPGLVVGGLVAATTGVALLVAPALPAAEALLSDRRATGVAGLALAYQALVRIPLGTAVTEELLFRGVLLARHRQTASELRAVLASSAAFGAWHIGPALVLLDENDIALGPAATAAAVGATVLLTTAAGVLFCLLRRWGRGLLAPTLAHAAFNGLSLWAASRFQAA